MKYCYLGCYRVTALQSTPRENGNRHLNQSVLTPFSIIFQLYHGGQFY
jgi:hypothetical protein